MLVKRVDCSLTDDPSVLDESRDIVVASVEVELMALSEPPSVELRVDAMLCFDADLRKKLAGREGAVKPGLKVADFGADVLEADHRRPRNLEAAEPTSENGDTLASKALDSM